MTLSIWQVEQAMLAIWKVCSGVVLAAMAVWQFSQLAVTAPGASWEASAMPSPCTSFSEWQQLEQAKFMVLPLITAPLV
jgi:hypothetical protein